MTSNKIFDIKPPDVDTKPRVVVKPCAAKEKNKDPDSILLDRNLGQGRALTRFSKNKKVVQRETNSYSPVFCC